MKKEPLLHAQNLAHRFDYPLFKKVSFSINSSESMAIVGRSGSGKSTLLHICSTFLKPQGGKVELFGEEVYTLPQRKIDALRRFRLGIIFQFHYLFKGMSGRENIENATLLAQTKLDTWILKRLEIDDVVDKKIGELSGGQQQRISIARVLSKKPRIIFADEPTGNLDKETASLVMDVLLEYVQKEDAALMMVTHDIELAKRSDKLYRLSDKRLVLEESMA